MHPIIFFGHEIFINPIAIEFGNIRIYWYGLIIVFSIFLVLFMLKRNDGKFNIKYNDVLDFLIGAIVSGFACARLYYVIFSLDYYIQNPTEILKVWHGRLSNIWWNNWSRNICFVLLQKAKN